MLDQTQVLLSGQQKIILLISKSYDQPSNCEEAGQVNLSQAAHRLPGQDRKSGILKPHVVS